MRKLFLILSFLISGVISGQVLGNVHTLFGGEDVLLDHLISYYDFDANSNDAIGSANLTEITGGNTVTFTEAGKSGNSAAFDGVDGTGLEGTTTTFTFTDGNDLPFSYSFYLKTDTGNGAAGDIGSIISKRIITSGDTNEYQLMHYNAVWYWALFDGTTTGNLDQQALDEYDVGDLGVWNHFVITSAGGSGDQVVGDLKIYKDGVDITGTGSETPTYTEMDQGSATFRVGDPEWSGTFELDGNIDGLGVWNIELSQAQVTIIYDIQNGGAELTD